MVLWFARGSGAIVATEAVTCYDTVIKMHRIPGNRAMAILALGRCLYVAWRQRFMATFTATLHN